MFVHIPFFLHTLQHTVPSSPTVWAIPSTVTTRLQASSFFHLPSLPLLRPLLPRLPPPQPPLPVSPHAPRRWDGGAIRACTRPCGTASPIPSARCSTPSEANRNNPRPKNAHAMRHGYSAFIGLEQTICSHNIPQYKDLTSPAQRASCIHCIAINNPSFSP